MIRLLLAVALLSTAHAEPPITEEVRKDMIASFEQRKKRAEAELEKTPKDVDWLTRRGDMRLFLGDAKGAVADFEQEISFEPSHDAPHWRLGIAYYFAGDFAKSAQQFAKYHAYDNRDRENGVWKFFAQARIDGIEKARKEMLEYHRFDREPFPAVYSMLAGQKTAEEVLAEMKEKKQDTNPLVMFFAHYYIGLNKDLLGDRAAARDHLAQAVKLAITAGADGGPGYMGQVARLHYEQLAK